MYNTNLFTHSKATKMFVAEASDLGTIALEPVAGNTMGIILNNPRTTQQTYWYLDETVFGREELTHWVFKPMQSSVDRFPALNGYTVKVFND